MLHAAAPHPPCDAAASGAVAPAPRLQVVSAVIVRCGRVLLTQRDPMRSDFGWAWECAGGKVNEGETPTEALCREIGEELGVDSVIGEPLASFNFDPPVCRFPVRVTFYSVLRTAGHFEPRQSIGMGWFDGSEMTRLTMTPGNEAFREGLGEIARKSWSEVRA